MVKITFFGLEQTKRFLAELPENTFNEIDKTEGEFMKFVQRDMQFRAPKLTGALAQSIEISRNQTGRHNLVVASPYGWFQEHGFTPHRIFVDMPTRAGEEGGPFISDIYGGLFYGKYRVGIARKHTPFANEAIEKGLNMLPDMLKSAAYRGAKKSKQ